MLSPVLVTSIPILTTLLAFFKALHSNDGPRLVTCIVQDHHSATMVQHLVDYHFANGLPVMLFRMHHISDIPKSVWKQCADNRAILILERIEIYAQLIRDTDPAAEMQSILLSTQCGRLDSLSVPVAGARLLYAEPNTVGDNATTNTDHPLKWFAWKPDDHIGGATAKRIAFNELWDRHHLHMQLFWGTLRTLPKRAVFRAHLVPPLHINTCHTLNAEATCHIIGPHVFIINAIVDRLAPAHHRTAAIVSDIDGYNDWFAGFFNASLGANRNFPALGNVRDAVWTRNRGDEKALPKYSYRSPLADLTLRPHEIRLGVVGNSRMQPFFIETLVVVVPLERGPSAGVIMVILRTKMLAVVVAFTLAISAMRMRIETQSPTKAEYPAIVLDSWGRALGIPTSGNAVTASISGHRILLITLAYFAIMLQSMLSSSISSNIIVRSGSTQQSVDEILINTTVAVPIQVPIETVPEFYIW